jgi:hypothetical protein
MSTVASRIRLFFVVSLLSIAASSASASCSYWECSRGYDTAECWERFGPDAPRFRWGTDCQTTSSCMMTYSEVWGWTWDCSYNCRITDCYEV